jgi:subtilisin family serine protease
MNRLSHNWRFALGGAVMALSAAQLCAQDVEFASEPSLGIVPDHVVVKFKEEKVKKRLKLQRNVPLHRIRALLDLPAGAKLRETVCTKWLKERRKEVVSREPPDDGAALSEFMYLDLPPGLTPEKCVERLKDNPLVEYVEVDPIGEGGAIYPADPDYNPNQWSLIDTYGWDHIHAPEAWGITTGSVDIVVAVLDTGCDTNILEFRGRTVPGYNFVSTNTNIADDNGHGTAVAGVLCATANNGTNIAGVDWCCRLMPVKVLNAANSGAYSDWAQGITWAVNNGAHVINLSAGGTNWSWTSLSNAVSSAVSNGVVFVTVTHNYNKNLVTVPGLHPDAITVGATMNTGRRWTNSTGSLGSNYGTNIALVAPGSSIRTFTNNAIPTTWSGTSFAAPHVAGVASLILSIRPGLNCRQIRDLLCAGADDQVSDDSKDTPGCDKYYGWGRLNAYNSLRLARTEIGGLAATNNGAMALSWWGPTNANGRQAFQVDYAVSLTGRWTSVTGITYTGSNAVWADTNAPAASQQFYRVRTREFLPCPGD